MILIFLATKPQPYLLHCTIKFTKVSLLERARHIDDVVRIPAHLQYVDLMNTTLLMST